jgi:hypothetical protein
MKYSDPRSPITFSLIFFFVYPIKIFFFNGLYFKFILILTREIDSNIPQPPGLNFKWLIFFNDFSQLKRNLEYCNLCKNTFAEIIIDKVS